MIDWDLEAPGLHRYVHPFLDDPDLADSPGLIDFVISYTEEASSKHLDENLDPKWFAPYANITRFAIPLDYVFPNGGALDFIPAGEQGPRYAGRVNSFNWKDFYVRLGGRAVLEEARERLRAQYDFVLIDSRTGVSDTSGICTVQMPDDVVICFTLNMQSVTGAAAAARSILEQRPKSPPNLFPVAMRVVDAEKIKTDTVREYAKAQFLHLMNDAAVEPSARDKYWHEVEIRQIAFYAFEEQLAYFLDAPNDLSGVLGSTKGLVGRLTKVDVRDIPGPDPQIRQQVLNAYADVWSGIGQVSAAEAPKRLVYLSLNESSGVTSFSLQDPQIPADTEMVRAADLPRNQPWRDAFRGVLRRCAAMLVLVDDHGLSAAQQRELAVALDYQAHGSSVEAFSIFAVSLPGAHTREFPGLPNLSGWARPYPGLRPFDTEDSPVFFGNEIFLDKLLEQMLTAPVIVVGGPPGRGKTSAIRAGLVPRLFRQEAPRPTWKVAFSDIAGDPLASIVEALVRTRGTAQFEAQVRQETSEVVARLPREGPSVLIELVSSVLAAWPPVDRLAVIVEVGSSKPTQYLRNTFRAVTSVCLVIVTDTPEMDQIEFPWLSRDDLVRAIREPAAKAGTTLESGLAERIAADLEREEDPLGLLQFCMLRLYQQRTGPQTSEGNQALAELEGTTAATWAQRILPAYVQGPQTRGLVPLSAYEAIGGVKGAVGTWAERILVSLPAEQRQQALNLMCRLASASGEALRIGRQVRSDTLPEALRDVAPVLVKAGLLIETHVGDPPVLAYSLFHPGLAMRWQRLKDAVEQNAQFLHWRESFETAAEEYALRPSYGALLRGEAFAEAQRWLVQRPAEFTAQEADFIQRSAAVTQAAPLAMKGSLSTASQHIGQFRYVLAAAAVLALVGGLTLHFAKRPDRSLSAASLVNSAYEAFGRNDVPTAIADLGQSLNLNPGSQLLEKIYSDRAYYYRLTKDWDKAIPDLTEALALRASGPDRARLLEDRAFAYIQVRQPQAALVDYAALATLRPNDRNASAARDYLTNMLTRSIGSGDPAVFVIARVQSPAQLPQAVQKLDIKPASGLNVRGWGNPIPDSEIRYTDMADSVLADKIQSQLQRAGITATGPTHLPAPEIPAGDGSGTAGSYSKIASRRIEIWLADR
jgi:tetratricopeptide (TPR) repeat protein